MKIDSTKQLDSLLKMLRKHGVTNYKTPEGHEFVLSSLPLKPRRTVSAEDVVPEARMRIPLYNGESLEVPAQPAPVAAKPTGELTAPETPEEPDALTPEQLLDWSVQEDPAEAAN